MLVVMEDRNVHQLAQALFDHETFWRLDVFEIDAAPALAQQLDAIDDLVGILGIDLEIDRVDIGKTLEQDSLALHHRFCRQRAAVAKAKDSGPVGDDRDKIALGGVVVGAAFILRDREDRHGDARGIGERKVALGRHWFGGDHLQFPWAANAVKLQGFLVGKGRPAAAGRGLGGHCYSMNATGIPGVGDVSGCNRNDSREVGFSQWYS